MNSQIRIGKGPKENKGIIRQFTYASSEFEDQAQLIYDLEAELQKEQETTKKIQEKLRENQEFYVKKEQMSRENLNQLEEKLRGKVKTNDTNLSVKTLKNIEKIQETHSEIMERLEIVQHKTIQIMVDQEKEIIKEYKDQFLSIENQIQEKRLSSPNKHKNSNPDLDYIQNFENKKNDHLKIFLMNEKLSETNKMLKFNLTEQENEINSMKIQLDSLNITNFKLKNELYQSRFSSFPRISIQFEKETSKTERNHSNAMVDRLKHEIKSSNKSIKKIRENLIMSQELKNEMKYLARQEIKETQNKIKKDSEISDLILKEKNERMKERLRSLMKFYDKAFPIKENANRRMLILPHNKIDEIEVTMKAIQSLYENYEKELKQKA